MISLPIEHPADAWQRLDRFIRKYFPNAPLGGIFKMLRTGKIKVNGKKKDQTYKIEIGDVLSFWLTDIEIQEMKGVLLPDNKEEATSKINITIPVSLDILYEDEYLMVVNKPPGINVHAGDHKTIESNIIDQVQDYLKGKYNSLTFRPALVHRIDRDTSGCLLIAKDKSVLESLLFDLQSHKIEKIYHTIVLWAPTKRQDTIRARLVRIENAKNEAKVQVSEEWQSAVTHYSVLRVFSTNPEFSLLECRIETGRTHQIRVHMAHIGYPVLADRAYGNKSINSFLKRDLGIGRQLLHAYSLVFIHPKTLKKITIEAPYPKDFLKILAS
jgi:23S rRNA pseudouridine955/2504/2580 synthase